MIPAKVGIQMDGITSYDNRPLESGLSPLIIICVAGGDFSKCLHIQEAMNRRGEADFMVTLVAFLLVCISISADRKQQLLNQHLRLTMLPPP